MVAIIPTPVCARGQRRNGVRVDSAADALLRVSVRFFMAGYCARVIACAYCGLIADLRKRLGLLQLVLLLHRANFGRVVVEECIELFEHRRVMEAR